MLLLQDMSYMQPNGELLFSDIHFTLHKNDKIAITGHNGSGKSVLLKLMAGDLPCTTGYYSAVHKPYYVPQLFDDYNELTLVQALQIDLKIKALEEISKGNASVEHFETLQEDWTLEERCKQAFAYWKLQDLSLHQKIKDLSGGQKTRVFLAGIRIHQAKIVLLDEPSNHLDRTGRALLCAELLSAKCSMVVVSHDRVLLDLLEPVYELSKKGLKLYGGNYSFYTAQKKVESDALQRDLQSREKAFRHAKETERTAMERQQKQNARGKKKQEKAGLPTIVLNGLRNKAEQSTSRLKGVQAEKVNTIASEMRQLRSAMPDQDKMKMNFDHSALHHGKALITAKKVNFTYQAKLLWKQDLNFQIRSGERLVIEGLNGSGKTTLVRIILAQLQPSKGAIERQDFSSVYIDQDYTLIDPKLNVYDLVREFNSSGLQEHELKIRLNRFLFSKNDWDKSCALLSGGEKMRLILCALTIARQAPDMIVLDEPTNNLDIQSIEILTRAIQDYQGTLLLISHDEYFLKEINAVRLMDLS
jgi:ATPase subunit of ABC transporter with duplicated ATPase domains